MLLENTMVINRQEPYASPHILAACVAAHDSKATSTPFHPCFCFEGTTAGHPACFPNCLIIIYIGAISGDTDYNLVVAKTIVITPLLLRQRQSKIPGCIRLCCLPDSSNRIEATNVG